MCDKIPAMATSDFDKYLPAPPSVAKRPDTLAMVKKLRNAGVPQQQAEAEVEVISEVADGVEGELRKALAPKSVMRETVMGETAVCEDTTDTDVRFAQMEALLEKRISQIEVSIAQKETRRARLALTIMAGTPMAVAVILGIIAFVS